MPAFQSMDEFVAYYTDPNAPAPPPPHITAQHHAFPLLAGELNLLVGIPGVGKSSLAIDLAFRIANARAYPPAPDTIQLHPDNADYDPGIFAPGEIIYASAESDDLDRQFQAIGIPQKRTIIPPPEDFFINPRIIDPDSPAGRNLHFGEGLTPTPPFRDYLEQNAENMDNPRLLVLDPLHAFINSINASASTQREALRPLIKYGRSTGIAILAINHLSKHRNKIKDPHELVNHIMGSLAFAAYARSILFLTHDPHNPRRRLLFHVKNNHGPLAPPMAFTFKPRPLPPGTAPSQVFPPLLEWEENPTIDHPFTTIDHPFTSIENIAEPELIKKSQLDLACDFLQVTLKNGPAKSIQVLKQSRAINIATRTLARARIRLQVACYFDGIHWLMSLPQETSTLEPEYAI